MAFLEIAGLKKRFGSVEILKGIDVELEKGGFLVLVGPSGCGKSTLLNTIAGLETITEGEIRVDGRTILRNATSPWCSRVMRSIPT
jgi:multiple sugar transport system ATP-binding protein